MSLLVVLSVALALCAASVKGQAGTCSGIAATARAGCGWSGMTAAQCANLNCCWDSSVANVPWCFHKNGACTIAGSDRRACGSASISATDCYAGGCCWDNTVPGAPACYTPISTMSSTAYVGTCTNILVADRAGCGWAGMTAAQCNNLGCCWDSSVPDVYWCFHKNGECKVDSVNREQCGSSAISAADCYASGCCWDNSIIGAVSCFVPARYCGSCAGIVPANRDGCGWAGMTQDQCSVLGCCWDNSIQNVPWCFHNNGACDVTGSNRVQCGANSITATACYQAGCCWRADTANAPSCYYPTS